MTSIQRKPQVIEDLDKLTSNHLQYNSPTTNQHYYTQRKNLEKFYKSNGKNITYDIVADSKAMNSGIEQRSNQRRERINELNSYLSQPIITKKTNNPYYDNSFHTESDNDNNSSKNTENSSVRSNNRIFEKYKNSNNKRDEILKERFEVNVTPDGEKTFKTENQEENNFYIDRPENYNYGLRRYGQDGEFLKKKFKDEEKNLGDFLQDQIRAKKVREELEREKERREEEELDKRNRRYNEDIYYRNTTEEDDDKGMRSFEEENNPYEDSLDRLSNQQHFKDNRYIQEDKITLNLANIPSKNGYNENLLLNSNSSLIPINPQETEETERKYDSLQVVKSKEISNTEKARDEGRKLFYEINKLTHNRYKIQAEAHESEIKFKRAMNDFRNLSEKLMSERVKIGIDLARENLKNMRFKEMNEVEMGGIDYKRERGNGFRGLQMYLVQNSILRNGNGV